MIDKFAYTDAVAVDSRSGAVLLGDPDSTIRAWYCAGKPLLSIVVGVLADQRKLAFDDRLHDLIGAAGWLGDATLADLLSHGSGILEPDAVVARGIPSSHRMQWIETILTAPAPAHRPSYSTFVAWWLVGRIVEERTGTPMQRLLVDGLLEPYDVAPQDLWLHVTPSEFDGIASRLVWNTDMVEGWPIPMLAEVCPPVVCDWNPGFGTYGTVEAMARVMAGVVGDLNGRGRALTTETASRICSTVHRGLDSVLGRDAAYGMGVMTQLDVHGFGDRPSVGSVGAAGEGGLCWVVGDPSAEMAVAVHGRELVDPTRALGERRSSTATAIWYAVRPQ